MNASRYAHPEYIQRTPMFSVRPDSGLPFRRHPAHGVFIDLGKPTIVFLTVCTKDRLPWLASDAMHQALRDAWDTRLRRDENYHDKWEYVRANPVRSGLAVCPEAWPYQGRMSILPW
jgi:hypothetical protein